MKVNLTDNKIGSYRYAAGRIRSLELKLMNNNQIERLFGARTVSEIQRVMQECGFESGEPEDVLTLESEAVYELVCEIMPEGHYVEALLLFNDAHNLKVILKYLSVNWVKEDYYSDITNAEPSESNPENSASPDKQYNFSSVEQFMLSPYLIEPEELFSSIRDNKYENIPNWIHRLSSESIKVYRQTYDISSIDLIIDRGAFDRASNIAKELDNKWFIEYFILRKDITNLESLLRCKSLSIGSTYFTQCLLPGGEIDESTWLKYYELDSHEFIEELKKTALSDFVQIASQYGQPGSASSFSRLADQKIMEHLRKALQVLSGPEIPLAYLLARQIDIKNIRIALTALRNNISSVKAKEMARESYLNWRV